MIFDSHTHLNAEQFNEDIPETIQRKTRNGGNENGGRGLRYAND